MATTLVALGLAGHLAVQYSVLERTVTRSTADRQAWERTAADLHRLGVRPPCLLTGEEALPIAFYTGCSSAAVSGPNANSTAAGIQDTARRIPVAHLVPAHGRPAGYARDWTPYWIDGIQVRIGPAAEGDSP